MAKTTLGAKDRERGKRHVAAARAILAGTAPAPPVDLELEFDERLPYRDQD